MLDAVRKSIVWSGCALISMAAACGAAMAQGVEACGPLTASFGPYDYRTADAPTKNIVEGAHFNSGVEALIRGQSGSIGGDLGYVLRVFPNHHRALISMMNLGVKLKQPQAPGSAFTVDCYFNRAIRFANNDAIVHMIHAKHLAGTKRRAEALKELEVAASLDKTNGFTQYNVGLIYLEMNEWDRALAQAHLAHELGFTRAALKEKLVAGKHWREPKPGALPADAGASAPAQASNAASAAQPAMAASATR